MALMFQRLARNYIKNGYFPTDGETIEHVINQLTVCDTPNGEMRLFDPCCGEGTALAELNYQLNHAARSAGHEAFCTTYGVEYDRERADQARKLLGITLHSDLSDCFIGRQQYSVLFLNPPYGDTVSDKASLTGEKTQRLEKRFFKDTVNSLIFGGVLVLILPVNTLDKQYANWLINHFDQLLVFRAAVDKFNQVVVFGRKKRVSDRVSSTQINDIVTKGKDWHDIEPMPDKPQFKYIVPCARHTKHKLFSMTISPELLAHEPEMKGLWPYFKTTFSQHTRPPRRPLTKMSDWHMALALTSGQVNGRVTSIDGRTLLIKGDTYKVKKSTTEQQFNEDGSPREVRTMIDSFVPAITAIDVTPGAASFGTVLNIK